MLDIMKRAFGGGEAAPISRRDAVIAPAAVAATAALAPFRAAHLGAQLCGSHLFASTRRAGADGILRL